MDATASIWEIAVMSAVKAASKFETDERAVEVMPRSAFFKVSSRSVILPILNGDQALGQSKISCS
jgi:hypothetical protein